MRIVATLADRTFYLSDDDLRAAWAMTGGYVSRAGKGEKRDVHFSRTDYFPECLELETRIEDGQEIFYLIPKRRHFTWRKANVRTAVRRYLHEKFRVNGDIEIVIEDDEVIARCRLP